MWHEYAHVLDIPNWRKFTMKCGPRDFHRFEGNFSIIENSPFINDKNHTTTWAEIMLNLGQTPTLICRIPKGKEYLIWNIREKPSH